MKKSKLKDAKFFCESCGSEVPRNAKVCPVCGKFFAAVRCPNCGRTGTTDDFKNGCPTCGYAVDLSSFFSDESEDESKPTKKKNKKERKRKVKISTYNGGYVRGDGKYNESSLPAWIYIVTILVFLGLMICLYSCL